MGITIAVVGQIIIIPQLKMQLGDFLLCKIVEESTTFWVKLGVVSWRNKQ